jgi:hypothetical protein
VERVRAQRGQLRVGDVDIPLLGGEVHFWRMDPGDWEGALRAVAAEGIPMVSTYLSWRRHVPEPDAPFTWRHDERLDVSAFLELCAAHRLRVQLKPGPWICAEEANGGYPDWLLADRELLALDASDLPLAGYNPPFLHGVPCYLHPRYLRHARRWIQLVQRQVRDYLHPRGPVVLMQLDNEPSYCFRDGMYEADYHPVVLEEFARRFADAEPPRCAEPDVEPGSERWRLEHDWIRFREWLLAEHLRLLRNAHLEEGATGVAFTVNYNSHAVDGVPQSQRAIRAATGALGGMDHYYEPPLTDSDLFALARAAAFARAAGEPIPWSPEIQAGIWRSPGQPPVYPDPAAAEQTLYYVAALAFGLLGVNFYMLVNRENWEFAPLDPDGTATPTLAGVRAVMPLFERLPRRDAFQPVTPVALAWHSAYARDAYAASARAEAHESTLAAFDELTRSGYLPRIWHTDDPPPQDAEVLVTIGCSYMPRDVQKRLAPRAARVVLVGEPPRLDATGTPYGILDDVLRVTHVEELPAAIGTLDVEPPVAVVGGGFAILHASLSGQLLFVLNPRQEPATLTLQFADADVRSLQLITSGASVVPVVDRRAQVTLDANAAAIYKPLPATA